MGQMRSCQNEELQRQIHKSRQIDRQIHASSAKFTQKLLLLGPGESGKSTCVKQMQILHGNGFDDQEIKERKLLVFSNTVRIVMELCNIMKEEEIHFQNPENKKIAEEIIRYVNGGNEFEPFTPQIRDFLKSLWKDLGIKEAFDIRNKFQCNDSAIHFLNSLDRISNRNYVPTNEDILHTRVPTTGVVQFNFSCNGIEFLGM